MAAWSTWFPDLLPSVPGCPRAVAEHELRRAAQLLCETAKIWQADLAAQAVSAGTSTVTLAPPSDQSKVVEARTVYYDGRRLRMPGPDDMDNASERDWRADTGAGPTLVLQPSSGVLRLSPVPNVDAASGITARVVLAPSDAATGVPDDIRARYHDAILAGAKGRLWFMPGKAWSRPDEAILAGRAFEAMVATAQHRAARGHTGSMPRSRPSWA